MVGGRWCLTSPLPGRGSLGAGAASLCLCIALLSQAHLTSHLPYYHPVRHKQWKIYLFSPFHRRGSWSIEDKRFTWQHTACWHRVSTRPKSVPETNILFRISPLAPPPIPLPSGPPGGAIHNHTVSVSVNWDLCRQTGLCLRPITENLPQELIENQPRVRCGAAVTQETPSCPRGARRSQVPLACFTASSGLWALTHTKHRGWLWSRKSQLPRGGGVSFSSWKSKPQ